MKTKYNILIILASCAIMILSLFATNYLMRNSKLFTPKESKINTEIANTHQIKSMSA